MDFKKTELKPKDYLRASLVNAMQDAIIALKTYQKPWNVDGHIGVIAPERENVLHFNETSSLTDNIEDVSKPIYMKNSGKLYISFYVRAGQNGSQGNHIPEDYDLKVYINDKLVKTYVESDFTYLGLYHELNVSRLLLNVKKGDYIIFKSNCIRKKEDYTATITVDVKSLEANVETPYTYLELLEGTGEMTKTDVWNILNGGVE